MKPQSRQLREIDADAVWPADAGRAAVQLLDVRSESEAERARLPGAIVSPILDDGERHEVGKSYHHEGQDAATQLGHELTAPHREARIAHWRKVVEASDRPVAFVCWRGGKRSGIAYHWLDDGNVSRVRGGSKALRQFLLKQIEPRITRTKAIVVSGLTGSGKTDVLHAVSSRKPERVHVLDLEAMAAHRGSAFGAFEHAQPTQSSFENELAAALQLAPEPITLLEDEGRSVGRVIVPKSVYDVVKTSPTVLVDVPLAERTARIAREYVFAPTERTSREAVRARLQDDLQKLHKRLGGERLQRCLRQLADADNDRDWLDQDAHAPWIDVLLTEYYDPLYSQSLEQLGRRVLFRGDVAEVEAWIRSQNA